MSNAEFSISREDFETILSFVYLMTNSKYRPNIQEAHRLLTKIEDEMKKYENEGCDVVIELCQKLRAIPRKTYMHGKTVAKTMTKFINAVKEVVSDEVVNSI